MINGLKALALVACGFILGAQAKALPYEIVIGAEDTDSQVQNGFPFGTLPQRYGYPSTRYQQVFASDSFAEPVEIQELVFYATSNLGAPIVPATLDIYFSITELGVNEISYRSFDSNLGSQTRLFSSVTGGFILEDSEFAIRGSRYSYDPSLGNLLLDIRVDGAPLGHSGPFFAALGSSEVAGFAPAPFSRWHDFGVGFENYGLVTGFRIAISEPDTLVLLGFGMAWLGLARRKKAIAPKTAR